MVLLLMKDLKGLLVMFYCTKLRENNVFVTESSTISIQFYQAVNIIVQILVVFIIFNNFPKHISVSHT